MTWIGALVRTSGRGHSRLDDRAGSKRDVRWGVVSLVAVVAAAVGLTVVSTVHTGVRTYSAYLSDAASLRVGDDVRVAGIPAGTVTGLELEPDRVRMEFTVDRDVFVGDQTTLAVRMLTIVGGYFLAVLPAGSKPLGEQAIPGERVVLPYNLSRLFQDAIDPVAEIDGDVLRKNLAALGDAVDGSPDGFRRMIDAVDSIVGILDRQKAQVTQALAMSDEYLTALAENKAVVGRLIDRFRILQTLIENNIAIVGKSLDDLAVVTTQVAPLGQAWSAILADPAQSLADSVVGLESLAAPLGSLLTSVREFGDRLTALASRDGAIAVDDSDGTITTAPLCIPLPGKSC